jgi:hypothetical protein
VFIPVIFYTLIKTNYKLPNYLLRIFPSIFLIFFCLLIQAQRLEYNVRAGKINLGNLFVERHEFGDSTIYLLESNIGINLIFSKHTVKYNSITIYKHDTLIYSQVQALENDELDRQTQTSRTINGYFVESYNNGELKNYKLSSSGITNSTIKLYFNPANNKDTAYGELYGSFGTISYDQKNDVYLLTNLDNRDETTYQYNKKNQAVQRSIEYPLMDFVMELVAVRKIKRDLLSVINSQQFKSP